MRKNLRVPRILKIDSIENLVVSVVFNNGELRKLEIQDLFRKTGIGEDSPPAILLNPKELRKAKLENHTLSWSNVEQFITTKSGQKIKVPFEIGADVLWKHSKPLKSPLLSKIGKVVRETRAKAGLTQKELAIMSGTSRTYISRIENEKSDVELGTLRKIVETGLGKKLEIVVK